MWRTKFSPLTHCHVISFFEELDQKTTKKFLARCDFKKLLITHTYKFCSPWLLFTLFTHLHWKLNRSFLSTNKRSVWHHTVKYRGQDELRIKDVTLEYLSQITHSHQLAWNQSSISTPEYTPWRSRRMEMSEISLIDLMCQDLSQVRFFTLHCIHITYCNNNFNIVYTGLK